MSIGVPANLFRNNSMTTNMDDKELIAALRKAVEHTAIVGTGTFTDMINLAADRLEALQSASVTVKLHGPYGLSLIHI